MVAQKKSGWRSYFIGLIKGVLLVYLCFGLVLLAFRWELGDFARRWGRNLISTLALRRLSYEPPAPGSSAAGGIPFVAAIAIGLSAQWLGGSPW